MAVKEGESPLTRLLQWQRGETPGPWRITLFPTNLCNLKCKICWQRGVEGLHDTEETSSDRLLQLVDEAAEMGVNDWIIIGGGEPLIRTETIVEMCERIRKHGINGVLHTNATLMKPEIAERLVEMQWNKVKISLDGPTREINDAVRSDGSFDKATRNIRYLTELKRKRNSLKPVVALYTVITSAICDKIDQMAELAHDLGCDGGIELTTMVVHSDEAKPFQLEEEHKAALPKNLRKAIALADSYSLPNNFAFYLEESVVQDPNAMLKVMKRGAGKDLADSVCFEPWLGTAITAQGTLGPCCAFWDPNAQSIQKLSLKEAWLGPYMQDLRKRLIENKRLPAYCSQCPSVLFAESEIMREQLRWHKMNKFQRIAHFSKKAAKSLQRHGLKRAIRRGFEWLRIQAGKR